MSKVKKGIEELKKLISTYELRVENMKLLPEEFGDFKEVEFYC